MHGIRNTCWVYQMPMLCRVLDREPDAHIFQNLIYLLLCTDCFRNPKRNVIFCVQTQKTKALNSTTRCLNLLVPFANNCVGYNSICSHKLHKVLHIQYLYNINRSVCTNNKTLERFYAHCFKTTAVVYTSVEHSKRYQRIRLKFI